MMTVTPTYRRMLSAALSALALSCVVGGATAKPVSDDQMKDRTEATPKRLVGIDVEEQLETTLPDVAFTDQDGRSVKLVDYVDGELPVLLTMNYSSCPMLCSLQLNALVESLTKVSWTIGKDYRIVTVILDPDEEPARAKQTQQKYLSQYGRDGADAGWQFLTGSDENIKRVARAVGISYGYNEARDEYVHPATIVMATPDGRIARYLYGIEYHPKTVELSLVEVAEGKIGSTMDKLVLYCFHYDETEGRYAPVAMNIMRLGGGVSALALGGFLTSFWLAEARRQRKKNRKGSTEGSES